MFSNIIFRIYTCIETNDFELSKQSADDYANHTFVLSKGQKLDLSAFTIDIDNKTFSLYEKDVVDGAVMADLTYSGTWEQTNSTTISAHCNKSKDTGTGTESPQNWDIVLTIDGNNIHWASGEPFNWIWTKQ